MGLFGKANSPIGLDISSNTIRAAQLKPYSPKPLVVKVAEITVSGAVKDGEITDVDLAAEAISELWHVNKISERSVVLGISNQKVIVRLVSMPQMKEDELKSAVDFQAQDHIPIPLEEAILDYKVVGEYKNEDNGEMIEVILVAAQRDMISKQIQTLEKAKLKPVIVDLSSFSLVRSLLEVPAIVPEDKDIETAKKAIGIIDIGEDITNIVIAENYIPRFTRVTSIADNTFIRAVSDNMSVDYEEAKRLKNEYGFASIDKKNKKTAGKNTEKEKEKEKAKKVREILNEEAIRFISELKRSFDYAVSESVNSDKIERIIVSGKGSATPNLINQMQTSFQPKIELGNPFASVSMDGQKEIEGKVSSYAISLGLALRGLEG